MNKLDSKTPEEWRLLVKKSIEVTGALLPTSGIGPFTYQPEGINAGRYQITQPTLTVAPDPGRLVARFTVTSFQSGTNKRLFEAPVIAVFDANLDVVERETRSQVRTAGAPSAIPFISAGLVPRPIAGAPAFAVNTLAITAFGVGLLAAAIAGRRLRPGNDRDLSQRLLPHFTNLLLNQVHLAVQVGARGGRPEDVRLVAERAEDTLQKALDDWELAGDWEAKDGSALERSSGGETVRLWRPVITTLIDSYVLVCKWDRLIRRGLDEHIAMTMAFDAEGRVDAVNADVYYSSADTVFTVQKQRANKDSKPLEDWIDEFRKRSVEAGLPALHFANGVAEVMTSLAAFLAQQRLPKVKIRSR